ncbi:SMBT2 protein, partial [Polypterus senegalus]
MSLISSTQETAAVSQERIRNPSNGSGEHLDTAIKEKYTDWTEFLIQELTGSRTAPANLLEGPLRGKNTVDLIMLNSLIELQDRKNPFIYWIVRVIENVGGRLRLRYTGMDCDSYDIWLFYLDCRLRPVGWSQENRYTMEPPTEIAHLKTASEWKDTLENALEEATQNPLPLEVFKDHAELRNHTFTVGMKLEVVDSREPYYICPATVIKVYNHHYFQVTIDELGHESTSISLLCHADSPGILPVEWCLKNGVNVTPPKGYPSPDFDWADYLKQSGTEAAPQICFRNTSSSRGFSKNMKLEAVNPLSPADICVATISKVKGRLMWLHLEGLKKPLPEYIVDVESMDIFPVGWCEANGYRLTPPQRTVCTTNGKYCCSEIFVNHRCFSGPYLNKGRIAELPQSVGPGKCTLVLKEVLGMLINAAYKPGRVLRELQLVEDPQWNFQEETLKAKCKMKSEVAKAKEKMYGELYERLDTKEREKDLYRLARQGPSWERCAAAYYYGKRKKVIKPTIGVGCAESGLTKPTRRRKKRKSIFVQKKRRSSAVDYTLGGSPQDSEDDDDQDGGEDETASEETSSEQREDQTDTSSVEVQTGRPRRAAALRRSSDTIRPTNIERTRRKRTTRSLSYTEDVTYYPAKRPTAKIENHDEEDKLILDSNPLEWTVTDVVRFIQSTDCAPVAKIFQEQDIDGQALLLLTLPTVQECMDLKLGPAIKLCHQIERVKGRDPNPNRSYISPRRPLRHIEPDSMFPISLASAESLVAPIVPDLLSAARAIPSTPGVVLIPLQ